MQREPRIESIPDPEKTARAILASLKSEADPAIAAALVAALDSLLKKTDKTQLPALIDTIWDLLGDPDRRSPDDIADDIKDQVIQLLLRHDPDSDGDGNIMGPEEDAAFFGRGGSWN